MSYPLTLVGGGEMQAIRFKYTRRSRKGRGEEETVEDERDRESKNNNKRNTCENQLGVG